MENQQQNSKEPEKSQAAKDDSVSFSASKKGDNAWKSIFVFAVLGFFLSAMIFALISKALTKKNLAKKQKATPVASVIETGAANFTAKVTTEVPAVAPKEEPEVSKALPTLKLTGILVSNNGNIALINGRVVPEGGIVDGAVVKKVMNDTVELSFEGQKIVLRSR